jgi:hypothetical protein
VSIAADRRRELGTILEERIRSVLTSNLLCTGSTPMAQANLAVRQQGVE